MNQFQTLFIYEGIGFLIASTISWLLYIYYLRDTLVSEYRTFVKRFEFLTFRYLLFTLIKNLRETETRLEAIKQENAVKGSTIQDLNQTLEARQTQLDTQQQRLTELQANNTIPESEVERLENARKALIEELSGTDNFSVTITESVDWEKLIAIVKLLVEDRNKAVKAVISLNQQRENLEQRTNKLYQDLEIKEKRISTVENEKKELRFQIASLQSQIGANETNINRLDQTERLYEIKEESWKARMQRLEEELHSIKLISQEKIKKLELEKLGSNKKIQAHDSKIQQKEEEAQQLKDKVIDLESRIRNSQSNPNPEGESSNSNHEKSKSDNEELKRENKKLSRDSRRKEKQQQKLLYIIDSLHLNNRNSQRNLQRKIQRLRKRVRQLEGTWGYSNYYSDEENFYY